VQYANLSGRTAGFNELCGECPCNKEMVQWKPTCSMRTDRQMKEEADGRTDKDEETNNPFSQYFERG
jgi:hypothetical protein